MSEMTYTIEGIITDSKGGSVRFTNEDVVNLEIETGTTKRIINRKSALKLQELVKEKIKELDGDHHCSPECHDCGEKIQLQSLVEESEK